MVSFQDIQPIIIQECEANNATHMRGSGLFTSTLESKTYMLMYGPSKTLANRVATQPFLYKAAQGAKIRIPELIHHFDERGRTYLVIEAIDFVAVSAADMNNRIEDALWWLSCFQGNDLGPLGGGYIVHDFFGGEEAPLAFKSVEAMELYIEKGRRRIASSETNLAPVTFQGEPLMLVQGDMDGRHFGVDTEGNTVIMGYRSMSLLPQSFGTYALTCSTNTSLAAISNKLQWMGGSNMKTMTEVFANLAMTGDRTLGLDEYGKPKAVKRARKTIRSRATAERAGVQ